MSGATFALARWRAPGRAIPLQAAAYAERAAMRARSPDADLYDLLDGVVDPEVPVLSLWELGVLCEVRRDGACVRVTLTPTYSGCPAFEAMQQAVRAALTAAGEPNVVIETRLAPPWCSDWLAPSAREKLRAHGVAPPTDDVRCPRCGAAETRVVAEFGATACQALRRCVACGEPFPHFKPF